VPLTKIVSGGQTGVDRGALEAALECGFACGGWCPQGRTAEDGPIPGRYPLSELPGAGYEGRTRRNVLDADGTVIIHLGELQGGTRQTAEHCVRRAKPHVLIDATSCTPEQAAREIAAFVERESIAVLNVAGPRASKWPGARDFTYATVVQLLRPEPL